MASRKLRTLERTAPANTIERPVTVIGRFFVAGVIHGDFTQSELKKLFDKTLDHELTLAHEPDNQFDKEAVMVLLQGRRLGYVPAYTQRNLANNTVFNNVVLTYERKGYALRAKLIDFAPSNPTYLQLLVEVSVQDPEQAPLVVRQIRQF